MKALPLIILAVAFSTFFSLAQPENTPEELQTLRNSYANAKRRELDPLLNSYRKGLETLLTKFTKQGDLDGAMAVRKEIEALPTAEANLLMVAVGPATYPKTKEELVKFLHGTSWELALDPETSPDKKPSVNKFIDDDTVLMHWGEKVQYYPISARTIVIKHSHWTRTIAFAPDFRSYEEWAGNVFVHGYLVKRH